MSAYPPSFPYRASERYAKAKLERIIDLTKFFKNTLHQKSRNQMVKLKFYKF